MSAPVVSRTPLAPTDAPPARRARLLALPLVPRVLLSRAAGLLARVPIPRVLREPIYHAYARRFGVQLREAEFPADLYRSFGDFFARRLAANARVIDPDPAAVVSPADGRVVEAGPIERGAFVQAKGHAYPLAELVGSDDLAARLHGGSFVSLYLAPGDYHRFHVPTTGRVVEAIRIPGTLFPVEPGWVASTPRLFARNARVVTVFESGLGVYALVAIGAFNVGSIRLAYDRSRRLRRGHRLLRRIYVDGRAFRRGDELGRFELGSSLVLLLPPGEIRLDAPPAGSRIRVGVRVATVLR